MDTGEALAPKAENKKTGRTAMITPESRIEENIKCSELHREFFKRAIGKGFTFNVPFQNWLKQNSGKTYWEAIEAYDKITNEMKGKQTVISGQFEYNAYIRDFFADNPGATLEAAIQCWKYKKSKAGHNRYERKDVLEAGL